jgi:valyl-tRNA synthetase
MRGDNTLWLPGTDHAGIATQMVVENQLRAQGIDRRDLGREEFEKRVWEWKEQSGGTILKQMVRLGASCDWSRERFTLDPGLSCAVREVFVRLYEKGLIYRGEYMVNWCPRCHTALSDLEVVHDEVESNLWHLRYPVEGREGEYLVVATTRPETMLGDTAVAIHPRDARYLRLHGGTVMLPLMHRSIPIILDELADPEFGTGVVKVTPAHDANDFEAGKRHNLPKIKVINEEGRMTAEARAYAGLDRFEARRRVMADLEEAGLVEKVQPYTLPLGKCQRCKTPVEPQISTQWFVRMKPLAEPAIAAVEDGRIVFTPENWVKTYNEWMYNIRDWCISRQLWWGHRIPAWHCEQCGQTTVGREDPVKCAHCGSGAITQDPDVLDTWFSSALWPFSTLGWPEETDDLQAYYPTSLLITGFDILFFWVARMIMMGLEFRGDVPFRQVYIHGLVRDAERQKMSKTRGNVVDPLQVIEQFGTDAVRFTLLVGAGMGSDIVLTEERMASSRAFANKIWNAARLIFMNRERSGVGPWLPEGDEEPFVPVADPDTLEAPLEDRWIFQRLNATADLVNRSLEAYRYKDAAEALWGFFWHEFCDWYLEFKKLRFQEGSGLNAHWKNTLVAFESALRLLHPVMPFLTEELWQRLTEGLENRPRSLALAAYPRYRSDLADLEAATQMATLQEIITAARNLRSDVKAQPKQSLEAVLYARGQVYEAASRHQAAIERFTNMQVDVQHEEHPQLSGPSRSTPSFDLILRVSRAEAEAQRKRLEKEIQQLNRVIGNSRLQLGSEEFLARAPEHVVNGIRAKLTDYEAQLAKSQAALDELAGS